MKNWIFLFFSICSISLAAQSIPQNYGFTAEAFGGYFFKHSSEIKFPAKGISSGMTLFYNYDTYGKEAWSQWRNYPTVGIGVGFLDIDQSDIYGTAFHISPFINTYSKWRGNSRGYFRVTSGLAYLTKRYDEIDNPDNTAIGSNWNVHFSLLWGWQWRIQPNLDFNIGAGVVHFSNGGTTAGNLGINVLSLQTGIKYIPKAIDRKDYISNNDKRDLDRKFSADIETSFSLVQHDAGSGGSYFPIYIHSLNIGWDWNKVHRWMAGFEYEKNLKVLNFLNHIHKFEPDERDWQASRVQFFLGDELRYNRISGYLKMGISLTNHYKEEFLIYNKIGLRWYMIESKYFNLYGHIVMKSQLAEAEYLAFGLGVRF